MNTRYVLAARLVAVSNDVMSCLDKVYITYVAPIGRECMVLAVSKDGIISHSVVGMDSLGYECLESIGDWHPLYAQAFMEESTVNANLERLLSAKNKEINYA